jgi:RHS repeat-associated protein
MEISGSGALIREYAHYPGIDQPHSMKDASGVYYYAMEYPGHVKGLFNASNAVVNEYAYDPWGEMSALTENVQQPLRYMARELDPITGLYYVRNRWYDPVMNRFVSEDPIGLEGGINTYAYVGNSPTNFRDPLGLDHNCYETTEIKQTATGMTIVVTAARGCGKWGHRGNPNSGQAYTPIIGSTCHGAGCLLREPTAGEYNQVFEVILALDAAGDRVHEFCGRMAVAALGMVNRQLAFWDNETVNNRGDKFAGEAPYDFSRGGIIMYINSRARSLGIAVGHEAVHGTVRRMQGGQPLYYPDIWIPNSPNRTPLGTPDQAARRCLGL